MANDSDCTIEIMWSFTSVFTGHAAMYFSQKNPFAAAEAAII